MADRTGLRAEEKGDCCKAGMLDEEAEGCLARRAVDVADRVGMDEFDKVQIDLAAPGGRTRGFSGSGGGGGVVSRAAT